MDMMTNRFNWCAILTDSNRFANSGGKSSFTPKQIFFCSNTAQILISKCIYANADYGCMRGTLHPCTVFFSGRSNELALRAKIIVAWCNFINHTFKMQNSIWIIASFFSSFACTFSAFQNYVCIAFSLLFYVWEKSGHALIVRDYVLLFFVGKKKLVKQYEFVLQFSLVESQIAWHFAIHKSTYTISKFCHHTQFEINEKPTVNILLSFWISLGTWQKSFRCSEMEIECSASL